MGVYKVVRTETGMRDISQIDPIRQPDEYRPNAPERAVAADDGKAAGVPFQPSPVLVEITTGLYEQNAQWATERVARLDSVAELRRVKLLETNHPKYDGGRSTVIDAVEERIGELAAPAPEQDPADAAADADAEGEATGEGQAPEEATGAPGTDRVEARKMEEDALRAIEEGEAGTFACEAEGCDFEAASDEGLAAHVEAHHGG